MVGGRGKLFYLRTGVLVFSWGSGSQLRKEVLCGDREGTCTLQRKRLVGDSIRSLIRELRVKREGRSKIEGINRKETVLFGQCFMFQRAEGRYYFPGVCIEKGVFYRGAERRQYFL